MQNSSHKLHLVWSLTVDRAWEDVREFLQLYLIVDEKLKLGTERGSDLPEDTQRVRDWVEAWAWAPLLSPGWLLVGGGALEWESGALHSPQPPPQLALGPWVGHSFSGLSCTILDMQANKSWSNVMPQDVFSSIILRLQQLGLQLPWVISPAHPPFSPLPHLRNL